MVGDTLVHHSVVAGVIHLVTSIICNTIFKRRNMKTLTINIPDETVNRPGALYFRLGTIAAAIELGFTEGQELGINWELKDN